MNIITSAAIVATIILLLTFSIQTNCYDEINTMENFRGRGPRALKKYGISRANYSKPQRSHNGTIQTPLNPIEAYTVDVSKAVVHALSISNGVGNATVCEVPKITTSVQKIQSRVTSPTSTQQPLYRPHRILFVVTESHITHILNWLLFFHEHCASSNLLFFVCMDPDTNATLARHSLQCSYTLPKRVSINHVWSVRMRLAREIMHAGYDVLISDSDALWTKNPYPLIAAYPNADIVASQGSYPDDAVKQLGTAVCMGFVYFKATSASILLLEAIAMNTKLYNDQRAFNQFLIQAVTRWEQAGQRLDISKVEQLKHTVALHASGTVRRRPFNITLLPEQLVRRNCTELSREESKQAYVLHCGFDKMLRHRAKLMQKYGLWRLRLDWRSQLANYSRSSSDFVNNFRNWTVGF